ncbi:MAG: MerC domain-containing protein [bacterium]
MAEKTPTRYLDTFGAFASTACAVHCLLTPVVIAVLPLLGASIWATPWLENGAVLLALVLGLTSLLHGYSHHRQFRALGLLLGGVVLLIAGRWMIGHASQLWETVFVVAGGMSVAGAHLINRRLCQACDTCHHS